MKYLITAMLLLIAFKGISQEKSKDSLVCFTIEQASKIAESLDKLEICEEDVLNKQTIVTSLLEKDKIITLENIELEKTVKELTVKINNSESKRRRAVKQKFIWGGVGVVAGYLIFSIIQK